MAFLVQHSVGRDIAMKAAAARERKTRYNIRIAVQNVSKLEPRQLALRLLSASLLALLICVCLAKLLSVLSSQVLSGNGVYLQIEGSRVGSEPEGIELASKVVSSWEGSASVDVPQGPSAPPILSRFDGDPSRSSPDLDTALRSDIVKNRTDLMNKLGTDGQDASSAGYDRPPAKDDSSRKSPKSEVTF